MGYGYIMTFLYGILGHPLGHTLSPAMQNAAFAAAGIDAAYLPLAIPPDRVRKALSGLKTAGFSGFNVTVPYKETVIPFLARIDPSARAAGAVNTIVVSPKSGQWIGHNTDVFGFQMLLRRARIRPAGKRVLLIGAGGAAKAVCAALLASVKSIEIVNRTPARARRLRASFPEKFRRKIRVGRFRSASANPAAGACDIIINSTTVGLKKGDRLPISDGRLKSAEAVIDLIYNPPMTDFLRRAKKSGCRIANGLDMLLYQGARAFELWTGRPAPVAVMRRALLRALP